MSEVPVTQAYIADLCEHPKMCLAFFGVQYRSQKGKRLYEESGIHQEIVSTMETASTKGLLLNRPLMTPEGPLLMQYWCSYEKLERWSRQLPHTQWWSWLIENEAKGVGFYHEIYQVKTAEAIYEGGTQPVGPALFCSLHPVKSGEGKSQERQQNFIDAASKSATSDPPT